MFLCVCTSDSLRDVVQVTVPQSIDGVTTLSDGQQHVTAVIRHLKTHTHTLYTSNMIRNEVPSVFVCYLSTAHPFRLIGKFGTQDVLRLRGSQHVIVQLLVQVSGRLSA